MWWAILAVVGAVALLALITVALVSRASRSERERPKPSADRPSKREHLLGERETTPVGHEHIV